MSLTHNTVFQISFLILLCDKITMGIAHFIYYFKYHEENIQEQMYKLRNLQLHKHRGLLPALWTGAPLSMEYKQREVQNFFVSVVFFTVSQNLEQYLPYSSNSDIITLDCKIKSKKKPSSFFLIHYYMNEVPEGTHYNIKNSEFTMT